MKSMKANLIGPIALIIAWTVSVKRIRLIVPEVFRKLPEWHSVTKWFRRRRPQDRLQAIS
jgi:hypothetical protein